MIWAAPDTWWHDAAHPPRHWQAEALPRIVDALGDAPVPSIVQAVMGAGKSWLIAETARSAVLKADEVIVITTPTRKLVEQLCEDVAARCGVRQVGRFYSEAKEASRPVIVACTPSAPRLAAELARQQRRCVLWIADEAHRTECRTIHEAAAALQAERALGFSATPYRSSRYEELSLWRQEIVRYDTRQALADGVIVPWVAVPWSGEEGLPVDEVCVRMVRHGAGIGPGLVNAVDCADAEAHAHLLTSEGIPAAAVHSNLSADTISARIEALRQGELAAVVHVSMLQEGVNLPWLRWLCLRRPGMTSVRFAQEVGRVLRAHPGKDRAIVYDPHDHFATFDLSLEAVLEGMADEAPPRSIVLELVDGQWLANVEEPLSIGFWPGRGVLVDLEAGELATRIRWVEGRVVQLEDTVAGDTVEIRLAPRPAFARKAAKQVAKLAQSKLADRDAAALGIVEAYLRQVTVSLDQLGVVERRLFSRDWRERPASKKQRALIEAQMRALGSAAKRVPEPHRSALRNALRATRGLSQGAAGDLVTVLRAIRLAGGWPASAAGELLEVR